MISYFSFARSPFGPTDCHSPARLLSRASAAADWISAGVAGVFAPIVLEISSRSRMNENRLLMVMVSPRQAFDPASVLPVTLSTDGEEENRHISAEKFSKCLRVLVPAKKVCVQSPI